MNDDVQSKDIQVDEPRHVVRTYASDVAALAAAGKVDASNVPKLPEPAPAPAPVPVPAPEPPAVPAPAPAEPVVTESAAQPAADTEGERTSILARLKARAGAYAEEPAPPPETGVSRFSTIPTTFDQFGAAPPLAKEPAPPRPMPVQPPQTSAPERPNPIPSLASYPAAAPQAQSPLHTYTGDFADRINAQGATAFSVLAQEKDSRAAAPAPIPVRPHRARTILAVIGSVLLVALGAGGLFYAYTVFQAKAPVMVAPGIPSLIFVDDRVALEGSTDQLRQGLLNAEMQPLGAGQVRLTYYTIATTTAAGGTENIPQPGGALVAALMLPAPDLLLRQVLPDSTMGVVHAGDETRPFFILRVSSYDRSFAGMLQWEPTLARDLARIYPAYPTVGDSDTASSTGTSVAPASVPYAPQFQDEIISNHDARVLRDAAGRTLLLYGYRDEQTLIIARDEAAFTELLNRLAASKQ